MGSWTVDVCPEGSHATHKAGNQSLRASALARARRLAKRGMALTSPPTRALSWACSISVRAISARSQPCHGDFLGDPVAADCLGEKALGSPFVPRAVRRKSIVWLCLSTAH